MTLSIGQTFTMARAQVVCQDTTGGTKTVIAKGATFSVLGIHPKSVVLRFEGSMYEVAKSGSYALAVADQSAGNDDWRWDPKKGVYRRPVEWGQRIAEVRPSVALRLLRNAT